MMSEYEPKYPSVRVSDGNTKWCTRSKSEATKPLSAPTSRKPPVGNQPVRPATIASSNIPKKNSGVAYKTIVVDVDTRSNRLPLAHPAFAPIYKPIQIVRTVETPTNINVAGSRSVISRNTGRVESNDLPKSSCNVDLIYATN